MKYRFRVRFDPIPGQSGGLWRGDAFHQWLVERLGHGNFAYHPDSWEGHGIDTYALHFNDHTIIPDLLTFRATLEVINSTQARFAARLSDDQIAALAVAVPALQVRLEDRLHGADLQTVWALGRCDFVRGDAAAMGDRLRLAQINLLAMVKEKLDICAGKGGGHLVIDDRQRGAIELGLVLLKDLRPQPMVEIEAFTALTDSLSEVVA